MTNIVQNVKFETKSFVSRNRTKLTAVVASAAALTAAYHVGKSKGVSSPIDIRLNFVDEDEIVTPIPLTQIQ